MAEHKTWIVTASGDRPLADLHRDLIGLGFEVDQAMDAIGVITGRSDDAVAAKVRGLRGIADVAPDSKIDIGPPGSDRTW